MKLASLTKKGSISRFFAAAASIKGRPPAVKSAALGKQFSEKRSFSIESKLAIALSLFCFILYANTISNGYAMDDIEILQNNSFVLKGLQGIPEILSTPHLRGFMIAPNETYRPLSLVMFAVEYQFWGANPSVNHFFNIVVYILGVLSLFTFLRRLLGPQRLMVAFAAAMLFAVHPIHTEVVANVKSRDELLCFLFGMSALNLFISYMEHNMFPYLVLGIGSMFLSLLSKETDITFLAVIPLLFFLYKNNNRKRAFIIFGGAVAAAAAFLLLRAHILDINGNEITSINMIDNELAKAPSLAVRHATAIYTLGLYLKLLALPYPLISDYSYRTIPFKSLSDPIVIAIAVAYISLAAIAIQRIIRYRKDILAFGILFYLLCLSLFANITFLIGSGMGERFLFCASAGFCLVAALGLEQLAGGSLEIKHFARPKVALVLLPMLLIFSNITYARNAEWKDNKTLYTADLAKSPNSSRLNYCVGYTIVSEDYERETDPVEKQKLLADGIRYLKRSIDIFPEYGNAQIEIGNAYFINKQYDSAEIHDKIAIQVNPNACEAMNNLAGVYFLTHRLPQAVEMCKKAIAVRPNYAEAYYNTGLCYYNMSQFDSSISYLRGALLADPGYSKAYITLAANYTALHIPDSVSKYQALSRLGGKK